MRSVSVILVNYKTAEQTCQCVQSLKQHCGRSLLEVIVVDNGSGKDEMEKLQKCASFATIISSKKNLGFGSACNLAARHAKGTYLYLLNSDTLCTEDTVAKLMAFVDEWKGKAPLVAVGTKVLNPDGTLQQTAANFPTIGRILTGRQFIVSKLRFLLPGLARKLTFYHPEAALSSVREVDWCTGASLMILKAAFDAVGGFDPAFFLYAEELDLCTRLRNAGGVIAYCPDTSIIHLEAGSSSGVVSKNRLASIAAGHRYYYLQRKGPLIGGLMLLLDYLGTAGKALVWTVASKLRPTVLIKEKANWHRQLCAVFFSVTYGQPWRQAKNFRDYFLLGSGNMGGDGPKNRMRAIIGLTSVHTRLRALHMLQILTERPLPENVLEFGFGEGDLLLALARRYPESHFTGWEIDPVQVRLANAKAQARELGNVVFKVQDYSLAGQEAVFDLIYCTDVLEHIPDDLGLIQTFYRLLCPYGRFVAHVPRRGATQKRFLKFFQQHGDPGHVREEYTPEHIQGLFAQAGFWPVAPTTTFGPFGEAAFELNSLAWRRKHLDRIVRLVTIVPCLFIGIFDALFPRSWGNSLLISCFKGKE
ncbi:MAG: hypothetical protein CSA22_09450 [Deltaproteobacteria bacterium]|nr:MAG: hypothetical protein CSA22_09450 [Deltaproteobacteria bacterium]